jgi:hypothetical protein
VEGWEDGDDTHRVLLDDYEPSKFAVLYHFKGFGTKFLGSRWSNGEHAVSSYVQANEHEEERVFLAAWAAAAPA